MSDWLRIENAVAVKNVEALLPHTPGKYGLFVDSIDSLPPLFAEEAMKRVSPQLLYLGKADVSLAQRVWAEECQHKRPGTFFRSIGAMLGYMSPKGGNNYEFEPSDKRKIVEWISAHLLVAWNDKQIADSHAIEEKQMILQWMPLLNLQNNPIKFYELQRLRAKCRAGAT